MKAHALIAVIGPTAVGKTKVAIDVAKHFNTEIISADSRQVYKELNLGTATPSADELAQVKHHFINTNSIKDEFTAGKFEIEALAILKSIFPNKNKAVLCGGSGLYVDALLHGIDDIPKDQTIRTQLNERLKTNGIETLQIQLQKLDPQYHSEVDLHNPHRVIRALEVCLTTGKPYSSFRSRELIKRPFRTIKLGLQLPREELYERINSRVDRMFEEGLLEEVKSLIEHRNLPALNTVGYREVFSHLEGHCTLKEANEKIKQNSRRYAKRQLTWWRKQEDINWFSPNAKEAIIQYCEEH